MLQGKRILITGAAGSIGSELVRQLAVDKEVYLFDFNETGVFDLYEELDLKGHKVQYGIGNIRDIESVRAAFRSFRPQIVFHAAAYKHVTPMEKHPEEAVRTNIDGTRNIIETCKEWLVEQMVYISTDKVIHANSVMGATKKVGEIMTRNAGYIAVRFGNVLGSRGSVIPIWQGQVDRGEPITITHPNMERYFMTIPDAVKLVIEAAENGEPGTTMIMDMGKPVRILDLAKEIIKKSEKDIEIKEIGIRPGETMNEKLMTEEEEKVAIKKGKFWVIK